MQGSAFGWECSFDYENGRFEKAMAIDREIGFDLGAKPVHFRYGAGAAGRSSVGCAGLWLVGWVFWDGEWEFDGVLGSRWVS